MTAVYDESTGELILTVKVDPNGRISKTGKSKIHYQTENWDSLPVTFNGTPCHAKLTICSFEPRRKAADSEATSS